MYTEVKQGDLIRYYKREVYRVVEVIKGEKEGEDIIIYTDLDGKNKYEVKLKEFYEDTEEEPKKDEPVKKQMTKFRVINTELRWR